LEQSPNIIVRRVFRRARFGQDKFILVKTNRIHYVEAGKGEPTLLVPGSYSTHRIWNRLMPLLAAEYRLLEPDYESSGKSVEEQTDLIAWMVQQMNQGKINLIGGAAGGAVVFDFAARYPDLVNKIVSLQGGVFSPSLDSKIPRRKQWYKINFSVKQSNRLEERAKTIISPILYLYGTKSELKGAPLGKNIEYLKNFLPHAWIVALEGGIHELSMHKPEEIADLILVFLNANLSQPKV
jgi:pimeloyl-ACP methyl ester carboxylesterase